jgi:hypothetical protein
MKLMNTKNRIPIIEATRIYAQPVVSWLVRRLFRITKPSPSTEAAKYSLMITPIMAAAMLIRRAVKI